MKTHKAAYKAHEVLTFDSWVYCPQNSILKKGRTEHRLAPQPNQVLNMLITAAPQVVSRQQFLDAVWADKIVNEDALSRTIAELRKLLGDSANQAKYIKTRPKKGYQFAAQVETIKTKKTNNRKIHLITFVFLLILSLIIVFKRENSVVNQLQSAVANAQRVTFHPGMEQQSVLSEDGQQILYVRKGALNNEIIIESLETTNQSQTIRLPGYDLASPTFIPNKQSIAMTAHNKVVCTVMLYDLDKQQFTDLATCHPHIESRTLDWNKANQTLYFSAPNNTSVGIQAMHLDSKEIYTVTASDSFNDMDWSPKISPDGQWLSFSRGNYSVRNLWLKNLNTNEEIALTDNKHYTISHAWYDSEHLVFDSDLNGSRQLWLINTLTKSTHLLGAYGAQHPSFDRSRQLMTFQEVNYEANIWLYDMQLDTLERIVHSTKYDNNPSFSPDSQQFVFSSNRQDTGSIWLYDFKTASELLLLSIPGTKLSRPIWENEGSLISITMNDEQEYSTVMFDTISKQYNPSPFTESHTSTTLVDGKYYSLATSKQNKGRIIYSNNGVQYKLPLVSVSRFMILPDGHLVYSKSDQDGLFHYDLSSAKERIIVTNFDRKALNLWTAVNQSVYYSQGGKQAGIWRFNIQSGVREFITTHRPFSVGPTLSVNSKENKILITRTDRAESDIFKTQLR